MKVLITGGTGFIGSRLALACLRRGDDVRVLAQENTTAESSNRDEIEAAGAEIVLGSVTDANKVEAVTTGIDTVFHLAATQHEMNVPDQRFWDVNVGGTKNVLEASLAAGVGRVVHGSTIGVYGVPSGVIDEQTPCEPENIYGVTKLEGEGLALSYADRLPVVVVRIPETYGPADRRLLKLFSAIKKGKFLVIGRGDNYHHLVYVDDLARGLLLAAAHADAVGQVFLLADRDPVTTREMVRTITQRLGTPERRLQLPLWPFMLIATALELTLRPLGVQPPLHRRRMDFFKKSFQLSTEKARKILGFDPATDFAEGVSRTADWYEKKGLM